MVETDGFGDFWFKDLKEASFTLTIEAQGFVPMTFGGLDTSDDVNLGEIALKPLSGITLIGGQRA